MLRLITFLAALGLTTAALAQPGDLFVYPGANQSPEQMAKDKAEFEQFMTERKSKPDNGPTPSPDTGGPTPAPAV